ncbi:DEAD-domain-containing protein [Baffinella frigidus]|nr:DEAD-domain-containing protein [Cryptophyta sp. CCMP2293]
MAAFSELGVMGEITKALEELGWQLPSPIQTEAIPLILGGGDVMGAAETGTGKTGAFGIPILQLIHEHLTHQSADPEDALQGSPAAPVWRMSTEDRAARLNIDATGLICAAIGAASWEGGRATCGVTGGRVSFEVECVEVAGTVRVGFSTMAAAHALGTCPHGFGFGGTGMKSNCGTYLEYGRQYGHGDVVSCHLDLPASTISFSVNGTPCGVAFKIPPQKNQAFYPAVCLKNAAVTVNFGETPLKYALPEGFVPISSVLAAQVRGGGGGGLESDDGGTGGGATPLCIMLEPSRDLALQTLECVDAYKRFMPAPRITAALLVGGVDMREQVKQLKAGVHVVVGTPGRIEDLITAGKLSCKRVRHFVLDEADRLLETGNLATILKIKARLSPSTSGANRLQTLMFSATLHSPEIKTLASQICVFPTWVDLKGKDSVPETVHHLVVEVDPVDDSSWGGMGAYPTDEVHVQDDAQKKLEPQNPSPLSRSEGIKRLKLARLVQLVDAIKMDHCLVFCRTNLDCDNLEKHFNSLGGSKFRGKAEKGRENPYSCVVLAGWRSVEERRANLQSFKDGDVRFLVATDVAARGIDISGLPYVVNVTLPDTPANYIHRIGRVGRADKMGLAISLVATAKERVWFCQKGVKGRGPGGRAPPCEDTRDYDKGGNCVWYDEPGLLKQVETLLGKSVERMPPSLTLRPDLLNLKFGEEQQGASLVTGEHVDALRPVVQRLAAIETSAQASFHNLRARFHRISVE